MILNVLAFLIGVWFLATSGSFIVKKDYTSAAVGIALGILVWLFRLM